MKKFLQELDFVHDKYFFFVDNLSIIHLDKNSTFHSMFKHVDMNYHGICDALDVKLLELAKIHTNDNVLI